MAGSRAGPAPMLRPIRRSRKSFSLPAHKFFAGDLASLACCWAIRLEITMSSCWGDIWFNVELSNSSATGVDGSCSTSLASTLGARLAKLWEACCRSCDFFRRSVSRLIFWRISKTASENPPFPSFFWLASVDSGSRLSSSWIRSGETSYKGSRPVFLIFKLAKSSSLILSPAPMSSSRTTCSPSRRATYRVVSTATELIPARSRMAANGSASSFSPSRSEST